MISHVKKNRARWDESKRMPDRRVALLLRIRQDLKHQLVARAKREHRSLNQQIEFILDDFLSREIASPPSQHPPVEDGRAKT